jgi:hypothetical protein
VPTLHEWIIAAAFTVGWMVFPLVPRKYQGSVALACVAFITGFYFAA